MQRRSFPTPMGAELRFPHQEVDWGTVNPGPSSYNTMGTAFGNMIGQAADVANSASRTPIVERMTAFWMGADTKTVLEGTLLACGVYEANGTEAQLIGPATATRLSDIEAALEKNKTVAKDSAMEKFFKQNPVFKSKFVVVLMNDLKDVTLGSVCHIGVAMQSSTVIRIPEEQKTDKTLAKLLPGDPLYLAYSKTSDSYRLITTATFGDPRPPENTTWQLLGYVTVPPAPAVDFGGSHLQVSLVPQAR